MVKRKRGESYGALKAELSAATADRPSGKQNKTQEKGGIKRSKSGRTEPSKAKAIRAKR